MSYQAYLDTIKTRTGKTPADFQLLATRRGLSKYPELMSWLKAEWGLGHGHANVIAQIIANAGKPPATADDTLAAHFAGGKAVWRQPYETLAAQLGKFGADVRLGPNHSYINVLRGDRKFAILQPATSGRFDIGIKLKGVAPSGRLAAAGTWNAMVTHRVSISAPGEIDVEVLGWLRRAYEAAG